MRQLYETLDTTRKETRWERIRKKYTTGYANGGTKTETVQRFMDKDYIGKRNLNYLQGEVEPTSLLNPALVMDIRHKMVNEKKISLKPGLATVENQSCLNHNIVVEERYIDNQIKTLRHQFVKGRNEYKVEMDWKTKQNEIFFVDNKPIIKSLEFTSKNIYDFYEAPIDALRKVAKLVDRRSTNDISKNAIENRKLIEQKILDEEINMQVASRSQYKANDLKESSAELNLVRRTPSPLTPTDEFLKPIRDAGAKHREEVRRVHFEDDVRPHVCERPESSCSNTSDGLDSIISDLAEEALLELQMEEQKKSGNAIGHDKEDKVEQISTPNKVPPVPSVIEKDNGDKKLVVVGESAQNQINKNDLLIVMQLKVPQTTTDERKQADQKSTNSSDEPETDETSTHEQNLIIEELFQNQKQSRTQTSMNILSKYFCKWIHYMTITKIERENMTSRTNRISQINKFLDKVRKEKSRISKKAKEEPSTSKPSSIAQAERNGNLQMTKKYQTKIKVQEGIIELQRLKLEQQERLITELKLKKLSDEAKEGREELKNQLKAVIRTGDEKLKAKVKCLQLIGNLRDVEDENELKRLQGKSLITPEYIRKMQQRAQERSIRHEKVRQRRLQREADREAQKLAAEEAKRLEDEEAKRKRFEALNEKRRMEKLAKIHKEQEQQRWKENRSKALDFDRQRLLRSIGMEGFKRLLERKREQKKKLEAIKLRIIKGGVFSAWHNIYVVQLSERIQKADWFYLFSMRRNAFRIWRTHVAQERSKYYVAIDWFDMKLSTFVFKEWLNYMRRMKAIEKSQMRKAIAHYEWNLKFRMLDCWQRFPQVLRLEKETEERRQRWRMKIWELLPDYTPQLDSSV